MRVFCDLHHTKSLTSSGQLQRKSLAVHMQAYNCMCELDSCLANMLLSLTV